MFGSEAVGALKRSEIMNEPKLELCRFVNIFNVVSASLTALFGLGIAAAAECYSLSFLAEILEEFHTFSQTLLFVLVVFCDEVNMRKVCEEDKMREREHAHTGASMRRRTGKSGGRAGERDSAGFILTKLKMYQMMNENKTITVLYLEQSQGV